MRACFKSPWKHFYIVPLSPGSTAEYQAPFPNDTAIRWQVRMRHENQGFIEGEVGRNKRYMLRMLWQLYQYVHRIKSTYCVFPIPGSRLTHLCWLVPSSQLEKLRNLLLSKNISNYISKLLVVIFGNIKIDFLSFFFFPAHLHFLPLLFEIEFHDVSMAMQPELTLKSCSSCFSLPSA